MLCRGFGGVLPSPSKPYCIGRGPPSTTIFYWLHMRKSGRGCHTPSYKRLLYFLLALTTVSSQYSRKRFYSRHFHAFSDYWCVPPFFFNMAGGHAFFTTAVGHAYSLNTELRRGIRYSDYDRKHTGVYVEKRPYHYYGDQPRLQLAYGATVCRVQERGVCLC